MAGASPPQSPPQSTTPGRGMGQRRFGRFNWLGLWTLIKREVMRFLGVYTQTILAPVATSVLFMTVFSLAFAARRGPVGDIPYLAFLAPGILMMVVIQNAFANTSSSIMISKVQGNIVDTLMPPLSPGEILMGYVAGGALRGLVCAAAVMVVVFPWAGVWPADPLWMLWFALVASVILSLLGILAGIWSEKFDQMAAITNFVITPLSFLSGTFYSIDTLPPAFQTVLHVNPFFYLIDGFRHGALGTADAHPWLGFGVTLAIAAALWLLALDWLKRGYRLKA